MRFSKEDFEGLTKIQGLMMIRERSRVGLKEAVEAYDQVTATGTAVVDIPSDVGDQVILKMLFVAFAYAVEALAVSEGRHVWPEYLKEWSEVAATLRQFKSISHRDGWINDRFAKMYQDMRLPPEQYVWYQERIFGTTAPLG